MAIKIYNEDGSFKEFEPGIIYALTYSGVPFYVGETTDQKRRLAEHQSAGRNPGPDAETKYHFIKHLNDVGIEWEMTTLAEYGSEGPEALEDEYIMAMLVAGHSLTNEKKGNANWMTEMRAVADDMRERGIDSLAEYKRVLAAEEEALVCRRTPEQIERLAKIMTGIIGNAEESYQYAIKMEKRSVLRQQREAKTLASTARHDAIADETIQLANKFPVEDQIGILQGLLLSWGESGCSEALRQRTAERLALLQETAK